MIFLYKNINYLDAVNFLMFLWVAVFEILLLHLDTEFDVILQETSLFSN